MSRADAILRVTERLYAAAGAATQWARALDAMIDLLGAGHAIIDVRDADRSNVFMAAGRVDERDLAHVLSPDRQELALPLLTCMPSGVSRSSDIISDTEFARSIAYNELIRPLNGFHSISLRHDGASSSFLLSVCRPRQAGPFETADVAVLGALAPHVAQALELQQRLGTAAQGYASLAITLDHVSDAIILANADGRPLHINARAMRLVRDADGLTLDDGGVLAATPAATHVLREAMAAVSRSGIARRLRIERPSQRPALLLSLLPIGHLGASVAGAGSPHIAIFISEPDTPPPLDRAAIAESFGLTRRESEIATLLASGLDLQAIAARLGRGVDTVRDHLKHLFAKTGTHSQAALVARLRGFVERL